MQVGKFFLPYGQGISSRGALCCLVRGANSLSGARRGAVFSLLSRLVGEIGCGRGQGWGRVRLGELPGAIAVSAASVVV